ncbi:MAG: hypothetical protein IPO19_03765 [Rhodoferax sp.]|nr:hypothetical protein [Rhodoferax sp.]
MSFEWKPSERESFNFSPSLARLHEFNEGTDRRDSGGGLTLVDASYDLTGGLTFVSLPANWSYTPDERSQWDLKWNSNIVHFGRSSTRVDSASVPKKLTLYAGESSVQASHALGVVYKAQVAEKHEVRFGVSAAIARGDEELIAVPMAFRVALHWF